MSGMVMNGPTPIMSIMLSAVALPSPIPRMRPGEPADDSVGDPMRRLDQARKSDWNGTANWKPETQNRKLQTGNWLLLGTQQIHIQPHRSRHTRRQLPEERVSRVDINPFAILRLQQAAFLRSFARIMTAEQRREMFIPLVHEVQPALLHPTVEIARRDRIGIMKHLILRRQNLHRSLLHRNSRSAQFGRVRREVSAIKIAHAGVVLHDKRSACGNEIEQLLIIRHNIFLRIVRRNSENDRSKSTQVFAAE